MIEKTETRNVTVLAMRHGKANALDTELLEALKQNLEELAETDSGVVLTGDRGRPLGWIRLLVSTTPDPRRRTRTAHRSGSNAPEAPE